MTSYINIRIRFRITADEIPQPDFVRYLSFPDNSTIGELIDEINRLLQQDNMEGDIYYLFDEQLENPFTEDSQLGGQLFPRNMLLIYTMIENASTLFVRARLRDIQTTNNNVQHNTIQVIGCIYVDETDQRLNNMLLNIPEGVTIGALVNYINNELARQFLAGEFYHINTEEAYHISQQTLLGGENYPPDSLITDMGIVNNSLLYLNCRITNPLFRNLIIPHQAVQLPIVNIDDQAQIMDLNSFLDVYETLMNMNNVTRQPINNQNVLTDAMNSLNSLNSLVQALSNPAFTNIEILNLQNIQNTNRRMEDVVVALDKDDLDKLQVAMYADFEHDRDVCSVCFEKFIDSDICRELKCKHLYHQICIDKWLNEHITCPVCREECGRGVPRL